MVGKNMSISVLISVYRSEKASFLDRALQSIWDDQTLKPNQIVLIEDGELGNELIDIIENWKKILTDRLIIVKNEHNLGLTKSLNRGLKFVTEDYVARMDSDDISMPERFELQSKFLDSHSEVMAIGGAIQEFNSENKCLGIRKYPLTNEDVLKYIHKASPLAHPTVMIRKDIFDHGLKYDERFKTSQDIALWFDILAAGYEIANLDKITLKFRREDNVYKRRSRNKAKNEFKIYMHGIRRLNGFFTLKYCYPIARYIFRLIPVKLVKLIYNSNIRTKFLESQTHS